MQSIKVYILLPYLKRGAMDKQGEGSTAHKVECFTRLVGFEDRLKTKTKEKEMTTCQVIS